MSRQKSSIQATPELRLHAITRRSSMSPAVATLIAANTFGSEPRDHVTLLASVTANRVASFSGAGAGR